MSHATKPGKILVALSGGVDSAVALALLLEQGYELMAVTLKTFCYAEMESGPKSCCALEGIQSARAVAGQLGVPHLVWDVSEAFTREVINDFVGEYAAGRTPNRCNATVKIPYLLARARELGCTHIATGHYARVETGSDGVPGLFRGRDQAKDQAYFLWEVPAGVLPHFLLPLGELTKEEVRRLADARGLPNARKPESQEICFVPDGDYVTFLRGHLPPDHPGFQPGAIIDRRSGSIVGPHTGFLAYTIGQRKGLGGGHGKRLFVVGLDPVRREVFVDTEEGLHGTRLVLDRVNSLLPAPPAIGSLVGVQIRHRARSLPGRLVAISEPQHWEIELDQPARAITPGQSGVLFLGDRLIAGGRIR
jgi:tRNA-specific 2-thiouridylase